MREKKQRCYIICLLLPGNIEKVFYAVQTVLFRDLSLVSARALPPVIPLCRTQTKESGLEQLTALPGALQQKTLSGPLLCVNGAVYADLPDHAALSREQSRYKQTQSDATALFAVHCGIFLGGFFGEIDMTAAPLSLPEALPHSVSIRNAALFALQYDASRKRYWEELSWEIIEEQRLRER
jgi:hypothetical protein